MKTLCLVAAGAMIALPGTASAQGLLGRLARDVGRAATELPARSATPKKQTPTPAPTTSSPRPFASPATSGPAAKVAPFPIGHQYPEQNDPRDLRFPQADKDAIKAFNESSEIPCNDCEGLKAYEAWARHQLNMTSTGVLETRLGALNVGEALTWRGRVSGTAYAITVTSAEPVGPFRCKQLQWSAAKGAARRERLGLLCWSPRNERWEEVL
jgi:hypothetical protein